MLNYYKENKLLIHLLFSWIILWGSLNSYPHPMIDLKNFLISISQNNITKQDIYFFISNVRVYAPLILTFFISYYCLFADKGKNKFNFILTSFFLIFLLQLIGLISSDLNNFNLARTFLVILAINGILIFYNLNSKFNYQQIKIFFYINLFFLILITFIYLPMIWKEFSTSDSIYFYGTKTWAYNSFQDANIRVTGLSRILLLLFVFCLIKLNDNISMKYKFFLIILLIFLATNIWGLQSRLVIGMLCILIFLNLVLFSHGKFFKNFIIILSIIFASFYSFHLLQITKIAYMDQVLKNNGQEDFNLIMNKSSLAFTTIDKIIIKIVKDNKREEDYLIIKKHMKDNGENRLPEEKNRLSNTINTIKENTTNVTTTTYAFSARNLIWKKIIKNYDYKKIFGYGPQADRHVLLKEKESTEKGQLIKKYEKSDEANYIKTMKSEGPGPGGYMSNASSAYFYTLICGGYFALLLIILINLYVLFLLFVYLKNKIYLQNGNFITNSIFLSIILLLIRSVFENSYTVFSLDFLIFISNIVIFEKLLKEKKINLYKFSR